MYIGLKLEQGVANFSETFFSGGNLTYFYMNNDMEMLEWRKQ